jgi:deoxyguanosine kinase
MNGPDYNAPRHIVVEGPIRVGKSTLARALAEKLHARRIFDCEGEENPFLADFYDEKPGAAFSAQMYFLHERHRRLMETRPEDNAAPIVSDFLFEKDKIFAYINLDDEELRLYEKYFDTLNPSVSAPDLVIYLQAKPDVLRKRVSKKGDPAETEISPEYLEAVANAYEHFFFPLLGIELVGRGYLGDRLRGAQRGPAGTPAAAAAARERHAVFPSPRAGLIFPPVRSLPVVPAI